MCMVKKIKPIFQVENGQEDIVILKPVIIEMFKATAFNAKLGREETGLLLGQKGEITNSSGQRRKVRLVVSVATCHTIANSTSAAITPEVVELIDTEAKKTSLNIVGGFHSHPWLNGQKFLSSTDIETLSAYARLDSGWLCIVVNPLREEYSVYRMEVLINER
jgi:proteasome lid subunit RPN8/RPN11